MCFTMNVCWFWLITLSSCSDKGVVNERNTADNDENRHGNGKRLSPVFIEGRNPQRELGRIE